MVIVNKNAHKIGIISIKYLNNKSSGTMRFLPKFSSFIIHSETNLYSYSVNNDLKIRFNYTTIP